jgi:hypothetical protein
VTVWYADGHHVDLAIYRRSAIGLEHAGGDTWNSCDPEAVPIWFKETNESISPRTMCGPGNDLLAEKRGSELTEYAIFAAQPYAIWERRGPPRHLLAPGNCSDASP